MEKFFSVLIYCTLEHILDIPCPLHSLEQEAMLFTWRQLL